MKTASNRAQALEPVRAYSPDALVLDMAMPVLVRRQFLVRCRADAAWVTVPFLVVSADPNACVYSQRLGAQDCLPKPLDLEDLSACVDRLVNRDS